MKIVFGISRMPPKKIAKNAVSSAERARCQLTSRGLLVVESLRGKFLWYWQNAFIPESLDAI